MNPALLAHVKGQIERLFAAFPDLSEDDAFRRDALEGETDLDRVLDTIAREVKTLLAEIGSIRQFREELSSRIERKSQKATALRLAAIEIMDAASLVKIRTGTASFAVVPVKPSVVIDDEDEIPLSFRRIKSEPDRVAIKDALDEGQAVPGAHLSNGGRTLRIA